MKRTLMVCMMFPLLFAGCEKEQAAMRQKEATRQVTCREVFLECEHFRVLETTKRSAMETAEELQKQYPGFTMEEYTDTTAVLVDYRNGKCDDHILFKTYRGKIGVYRENTGTLLEVVDVSVQSLREEDQNALSAGVSVFGKEERAAFLDDFSS